ncbi:hypothetical protein BGZ83_007208, partial [Gryganskiella cystojenkinii]
MLAQQVETENPLLMPDILLHLVEYFDAETLKRSLQVCHLWHNLFVPFVSRIWRRIDYQPGLPPDQALLKHAIHVLEINCESEHAISALAQTGIVFPNLKTLLLKHRSEYDDYEIKLDSIALLERHSNASLKRLRVNSVGSKQLLDAIAGISTLEHLIISDSLLTTSMQWIAWYENLSRLRVLHLRTCWVDFEDDESDDDSADRVASETFEERLQTLPQTQLEEIEFGGNDGGLLVAALHLLVIENSPRLKRLKWSFIEHDEETHELQGPMTFLNNA